MPQTKPEYEELAEFNDIAKQVVTKYQDRFGNLDFNLIKAVLITNKDRSENKNKLWELKPVPMPIRLDCPYAYYVILHSSDWDLMSRKHKALLVAQVLCALPLNDYGEVEEGKVNTFDMKDFSTMLRTFGPDYLIKDSVPDILEDNIAWQD